MQKYNDTSENLIKIKFRYTSIVLPYEEGLKLLQCLRKAESWDDDGNYNNPVIMPLNTNTIEVSVISKREYDLRKMSHLLGVTYEELKKEQEEEFKNEHLKVND